MGMSNDYVILLVFMQIVLIIALLAKNETVNYLILAFYIIIVIGLFVDRLIHSHSVKDLTGLNVETLKDPQSEVKD